MRAALFFRERLIALEQQHAATLRQIIEQSANDDEENRPLTILPGFANRPVRRLRATFAEAAKMTDQTELEKARIEAAANHEDDWVRARNIKQEAPAHESLLQIDGGST